MPTKLKEALETQKYYITGNLKIMTFLGSKGIAPYGTQEDRNHKGITLFFYGNSKKLRACLHEYFNDNIVDKKCVF